MIDGSTLDPDALYFCDNGAIYCGKHCGASAQLTGRDTSGQRVQRMTGPDKAEFERICGWPAACEQCAYLARRDAALEKPSAEVS